MLTPGLSSSLSGLRAQGLRLNATASNIANLTTSGAVPGSPQAQAGAQTVYRPLRVDLTSQTLADGQGVGVSAKITETENKFSLVYNPDAPGANAEGLVAVPDIDLAQEAVNLLEIKTLFKANAAAIRTQDELLGNLLDTLS